MTQFEPNLSERGNSIASTNPGPHSNESLWFCLSAAQDPTPANARSILLSILCQPAQAEQPTRLQKEIHAGQVNQAQSFLSA